MASSFLEALAVREMLRRIRVPAYGILKVERRSSFRCRSGNEGLCRHELRSARLRGAVEKSLSILDVRNSLLTMGQGLAEEINCDAALLVPKTDPRTSRQPWWATKFVGGQIL
jgi:hypothetical protein